MTTYGTRGSRNQRNNPYALDDLLASFHRSAAGVAWRWRTELAILTATAAALWRLSLLTTITWAAITLGALVLVVLAVPWSRRFTARRFWCVLGRHRIQRLCYEARLHTRSGRIPLVLWTRPTKVGERAHVLCRAGICAEDFEARIGEIRAACYARDARITRHPRWSQLVTIDVVRRDTLAAAHQVTSPLTQIRPALPPQPGPATRPEPHPSITPQRQRNGRPPRQWGPAVPAPAWKESPRDHRNPAHRLPAAPGGAGVPAVDLAAGAPGH